MIKVVITGRMGAGKSQVLRFVAKQGLPVFKADQMVKNLISKENPCYRELKSVFGKDFLLKNGEVDLKSLSQEVFSDSKKLQNLEKILHLRVGEKWKNFVEIQKKKSCHFVFCEIPLFKKGIPRDQFDFIILVTASDDLKLKRLIQKGMTKKEVEARWNHQMLESDFFQSAHFVIQNSGHLKDLELKASKMLEFLKDRIKK